MNNEQMNCDFCQKEITDQCVTDIDLNMHFHFDCRWKDHEIDELWEYGVMPQGEDNER